MSYGYDQIRKLAAAATIFAAVSGTALAAGVDVTADVPPDLKQAQAQIDANDYGAAIKTLDAILTVRPDDADANNLKGYSLRKSGKWKDAIVFYEKALAKDAKHLGANEYLGELYAERGELDKAKERLKVLRDACGTCEQAEDLARAIATAEGKS